VFSCVPDVVCTVPADLPGDPLVCWDVCSTSWRPHTRCANLGIFQGCACAADESVAADDAIRLHESSGGGSCGGWSTYTYNLKTQFECESGFLGSFQLDVGEANGNGGEDGDPPGNREGPEPAE
jgi:hypothetical protein